MHLEHMQGDAVAQVRDFLLQVTQPLLDAGVARSRIAWDYGIGFGKSVVQNFALLAHQRELLGLDFCWRAGRARARWGR
jgi:dihydropteroate synthase